jgi:alpha-mannosidase
MGNRESDRHPTPDTRNPTFGTRHPKPETRHPDRSRIPYGVALLNDCKYGFDVFPWAMRMTILRSPAYAQHDPHKPEPYILPQYLDQGYQTVTYRLVPHAGTWQDAGVPRRAWELNARPIPVNDFPHPGALPSSASFLETDAPNILLTVLKHAEDGDGLIVRGYETSGVATKAVIRLPFFGVESSADFPAHGIRSFRVIPATKGVEEVDLLESA